MRRRDPAAVVAAVAAGPPGRRSVDHRGGSARPPGRASRRPGRRLGPFRAVGTVGYDLAATYVEAELRAAGWTVAADAYSGIAFLDEGGSSLEVGGRTFEGADLRPLIFAPAGEVEGPVVAIDWQPSADRSTGKGCAVTHYGDLPPNAIVVVRSGDCLRRDQVLAAQPPGPRRSSPSTPGPRAGCRTGRRSSPPPPWRSPQRPFAGGGGGARRRGGGRRNGPPRHAHPHESAPTRSIVAELVGSDPGAVVMLGAHLDSVIDGPGINDDGSGVAALLQIARALGGTRPRATIRLAFWSGEELGLHGSYRYATALSAEDARAIVVYVNVDMIASPNGFAGVYDEPGAPAGSTVARELLKTAVERAGGTPVGVDLGGGSDHRGFDEAGVATAGVFSGAADPVTDEQAATSRAVAGRPADPCYHQTCDDLGNADLELARVLSAGLADFTVRVANNPELLRH